MEHVDQFLLHYGYLAIFGLLMLGIVGPLIPDETILVVSGVFIHRGQLEFLPAAACAYAGSVCGITLSYWLGYGNANWTARLAHGHLDKAEQWFARFGRWTLFFGYFIAGVRHFTALFAGLSKMPWRRFALPAYSGGLVWVLTFLSIGYFAGEQWQRVAQNLHSAIWIGAAVLVVGGILWWFVFRKRFSPRN